MPAAGLKDLETHPLETLIIEGGPGPPSLPAHTMPFATLSVWGQLPPAPREVWNKPARRRSGVWLEVWRWSTAPPESHFLNKKAAAEGPAPAPGSPSV